jgi:hypothetical protein
MFLDNYCAQFHRLFRNSKERIWKVYIKLEHISYLLFVKGPLAFGEVGMEKGGQNWLLNLKTNTIL